MLKVACVLKSGGIYDGLWVHRLKAGVAAHLPIEHRFVCLTDMPEQVDPVLGIERIPLEHDWPGWWAKIELFKLKGPVLYFDLDTVIVGDLRDVAVHAQTMGLSALRDFYRPRGIGTGVMSWSEKSRLVDIYEAFRSEPDVIMTELGGRGDQGFLEHERVPVNLLQMHLPHQIVSYKAHCRGGQSPVTGQITEPGIPANTRVVCLHGFPRFTDMPANDAVRVAWEMAA